MYILNENHDGGKNLLGHAVIIKKIYTLSYLQGPTDFLATLPISPKFNVNLNSIRKMSNWVCESTVVVRFFCMIRRNRWEKRERNRPLKTWFDQALSQNNFWWCLIEILTFLHCVICWRSHLCPISTGPILPTFSSTLTMTIPEMKNNFIRNIRGSFRSKNDQKSKKGNFNFFFSFYFVKHHKICKF